MNMKEIIGNVDYKLNSSTKVIKDIFKNLNLQDFESSYENLYIEISVSENTRPEQIAESYYGDPNAVFLVLFANMIKNPTYEWPMTERSLTKYLKNKYGSVLNAKNTIARYYTGLGKRITKEYWELLLDDPDKYTLSAYDEEVIINDAKRNIKIINPDHYDIIMKGIRNFKETNQYSNQQ